MFLKLKCHPYQWQESQRRGNRIRALSLAKEKKWHYSRQLSQRVDTTSNSFDNSEENFLPFERFNLFTPYRFLCNHENRYQFFYIRVFVILFASFGLIEINLSLLYVCIFLGISVPRLRRISRVTQTLFFEGKLIIHGESYSKTVHFF